MNFVDKKEFSINAHKIVFCILAAKIYLFSSLSFAVSSKLQFLYPRDGDKVSSTFTVKMALEGLTLKKAGEDIKDLTSGHHHIIVDGKPIAKGEVIAADEKHLHFVNAADEATLTLPPGKHQITLQFADGAHKSYGPEMSQTITIYVEESKIR
jgi:hypothetical protein